MAMSADYVRRTYGVDFKRGDRVLVDGRPGFIVSFPSQYLGVRFDGESHTSRCHPTWRVERAELLACSGCGTTYDATDPDHAGTCVHDNLCRRCWLACDRGRSCRDGCHERGER